MQHTKHRIVIWGLRKKYHTHRYIHKAFYENARKLGYDTLWVEDEKKSAEYIRPGDVIIASEVSGKMVLEKKTLADYALPIRQDVWYCLHGLKPVFTKELDLDRYIELHVYHKEAQTADEQWGPVTFFDTKKRMLYQPWGTDLLPEEFKEPVYTNTSLVFWIGSIWNNALLQGNTEAIAALRQSLQAHKLHFVHLRFIPDWMNVFLVRRSRIAPAIAGTFQVNIDYLPCRMFKNISYGQLGITNVKKFEDILGASYVPGNTIEELICNSLALPKKTYIERVKEQQAVIANYTYKQSIEHILRGLGLYS